MRSRLSVAAALILSLLGPVPGADAAPTAAGDAVMAMNAARAHRVPVEDLSARTERSRVFANPTGTWTMESYATPRWVRRDGSWVDVDTTLVRRGDGSPAPEASAADVRFSAGGTGPMVTLNQAGHTFTLSWPGSLPTPVLNGSSATYPEVVPGVDLVLRATRQGFSHVLVVKSRQAAANPLVRNPRFKVGGDVTMSGTPEGGLRVTSGSAVVAVAGEAMMWDSSTTATTAAETAASASTAAAPAAGARHAAIPAKAAGAELTLTPDTGLLDDPAAKFPIYIDPEFATGPQGWAYATSNNTTSPTSDNDVDVGDTPGVNLRVGRDQETGKLVRSFLEFPMAANGHDLRGKHVLSAGFAGWVDHTTQCGYGTPTYFYRTAPITAWPRQSWPGPQLQVAIGDFWSHANELSCNEGNAYLEIIDNALLADLKVAAKDHWDTYNIGMAAIDPGGAGESTSNRWKRYFLDDFRLTATYNSIPNAPTDPKTDGRACATGSNRPVLGTATPTLSALVTDPDPETDMTLQVDWHAVRPDGSRVDPKLGTATQGSLASGTRGQVTLPALAQGTYTWRTDAHDGTDSAPDNNVWCEFTVDTVAPNVPGVSSPVYKEDGNFHGSIGHTADFTFSANGSTDVKKYLYGWETPPTTEVAAPSPGASVTIPLTPPPVPGSADPTRGGLLTLYVRSADQAENRSPIRAYAFSIGSASGPVGEWPLNETSGTTLYDTSGYEHHATLSGGTLATPGPRPGETAVSFDGIDDHAATSAADGRVVDTANSFTVAAWVEVTDPARPVQTAVTQLGVHNCAFYLQKADNTWAFSLQPLDTTSPTGLRVRSSSAPQAGVWTHLTGVYDRGRKSVQIFVNGAPAGSLAWSGRPFAANGPLWIGQARWIDQTVDRFAGAVAGVRVWDRVLHPSEITRLATR